GAEINADDWNVEHPQAVHDTTAHAALVNEHSLRVVFGVDLRNASGELHRVDAWEDDRRNAASVPTTAEVNHRRIVAETAYVNADENYVGEEVELSVDSGASKLEGDKGLRVHTRENAAHTDPNEVVVRAVVGYPLSDLNLVGNRHIAGVDGF